MPNILFIQRKPKPLGTEFKCFVDSVLLVLLHLEIQEGKVRMSKKSHFQTLGATASCVLRAVDAGNEFDTQCVIPEQSQIDEQSTTYSSQTTTQTQSTQDTEFETQTIPDSNIATQTTQINEIEPNNSEEEETKVRA